jgi:hypothetical protein
MLYKIVESEFIYGLRAAESTLHDDMILPLFLRALMHLPKHNRLITTYMMNDLP